MSNPKHTEIRRLVGLLRKQLPLLLPVRVCFAKGYSDHGSADVVSGPTGKPKSFRIYLNDSKCYDCMIWTLAHEWAHCRIWREGSLDDHHHADFGVAWAESYRTLAGLLS